MGTGLQRSNFSRQPPDVELVDSARFDDCRVAPPIFLTVLALSIGTAIGVLASVVYVAVGAIS